MMAVFGTFYLKHISEHRPDKEIPDKNISPSTSKDGSIDSICSLWKDCRANCDYLLRVSLLSKSNESFVLFGLSGKIQSSSASLTLESFVPYDFFPRHIWKHNSSNMKTSFVKYEYRIREMTEFVKYEYRIRQIWIHNSSCMKTEFVKYENRIRHSEYRIIRYPDKLSNHSSHLNTEAKETLPAALGHKQNRALKTDQKKAHSNTHHLCHTVRVWRKYAAQKCSPI